MTASGPFFLYVTNIRAGRIEVCDTYFKAVSLRAQGRDDRLAVGKAGSGAPIYDVVPPRTPVGAIFNLEISPGVLETYFGSINSVPVGTNGPVTQGADTSLHTTAGYDNVTGLGTPNVLAFIAAFAALP